MQFSTRCRLLKPTDSELPLNPIYTLSPIPRARISPYPAFNPNCANPVIRGPKPRNPPHQHPKVQRPIRNRESDIAPISSAHTHTHPDRHQKEENTRTPRLLHKIEFDRSRTGRTSSQVSRPEFRACRLWGLLGVYYGFGFWELKEEGGEDW